MKNFKITTKIQHSMSQNAWNVVCTNLGHKYKIAVVPYLLSEPHGRQQALDHAEYISHCFNNQDSILEKAK
jgi:hypothetical protein